MHGKLRVVVQLAIVRHWARLPPSPALCQCMIAFCHDSLPPAPIGLHSLTSENQSIIAFHKLQLIMEKLPSQMSFYLLMLDLSSYAQLATMRCN